MRYGYFDNTRWEYVIDRVDVPVSWTNYIGLKDMYGVFNHTAGGQDADQMVTEKIEAQIACLRPEDIQRVDYNKALETGVIREIYPLSTYIDSILRMVGVEKIRQAGLRIAIDPMYGVSQSSLRTILLTRRCDVEVIHEQHDTLFGGKMPAPSAETLKILENFVVDNRCDLGIVTGRDADRVAVDFGQVCYEVNVGF